MFTGNTTSLAAHADVSDLEIVRDCVYSYVAKVPTRLPLRVVPCTTRDHIETASSNPNVAGIITTPDIAPDVPTRLGLALTDNPVAAAIALHEALCAIPDFHWQPFATVIHPSVQIHPSAIIAPEDVVIGADTVIHAGAIVLPRVIIAEGCSIGPGTVVGTDAFEVNTYVSPRRIVRQAGGVRIGSFVDIQAKCTIVRATFGGFTEIGEGSKFDCQVHLAHDCRVGRDVRIAACAEISGRVSIGDACFIGPNCSISNGLDIGAGAHITLGAVVARNVAAKARVSGNFAIAHDRFITHIKAIR